MVTTPERDHAKVREARREILDARDAALRDISQANAERLDRAWNAYDALLSLAAPKGGEDADSELAQLEAMMETAQRRPDGRLQLARVLFKMNTLSKHQFDTIKKRIERQDAARAAPKGGEDAVMKLAGFTVRTNDAIPANEIWMASEAVLAKRDKEVADALAFVVAKVDAARAASPEGRDR